VVQGVHAKRSAACKWEMMRAHTGSTAAVAEQDGGAWWPSPLSFLVIVGTWPS
jgi:hypothetical protein